MNPEQLQSRMADIILPPPPDDITGLIAGTLLSVVLLLMFAWITNRYRRSQTTRDRIGQADALQQLELIRQDWLARLIDARELAFRLATTLRLGLHLVQLPTDPPVAAFDARQWRRTLQALDGMRYPSTPSAVMPDEVFASIEQFLVLARQGE